MGVDFATLSFRPPTLHLPTRFLLLSFLVFGAIVVVIKGCAHAVMRGLLETKGKQMNHREIYLGASLLKAYKEWVAAGKPKREVKDGKK